MANLKRGGRQAVRWNGANTLRRTDWRQAIKDLGTADLVDDADGYTAGSFHYFLNCTAKLQQ